MTDELKTPSPQPINRPFQFSLRHLLICISVVCAILALVAWLGGLATARIRHVECSVNLYTLGIALHNYHDRYGSFPPAFVADQSGQPAHSWRVLILPYIDQNSLYEAYDFSEPWNGPNNSSLASKMPQTFRCPSDTDVGKRTDTNYFAVVGPGTPWPGFAAGSYSHITDETIILVEVEGAKISWMEPRDLMLSTLNPAINSNANLGISSRHKGGANVLFADGRVVFLPEDKLPAEVRAMLTPQ